MLLLGGSRSSCSLILLHTLEIIPVVSESLEISLPGNSVRYSLFGSFDRPLVCKHFVNVTCVMRAGYDRFVWGGYLAVPQVTPVDVTEEWMGHDIGGVRGRGAQPLGLIAVK